MIEYFLVVAAVTIVLYVAYLSLTSDMDDED